MKQTTLPKGASGRGARLREAVAVAGPPLAAAVLGNALIGKESMRWFRALRAPRMQVPMPVFGVVGAAYYVQLGIVLHQARRHDDRRVRRLALMVLAGNELWNATFFGRRSPRNGFLGVLVFLGPLLALQKAVSSDRTSLAALTPYTLWVVGYDVPWTYRLWQLNRGGPE
jgi:tryptophan-rich sensory protein